jgi:hypothetical protein
MNLARRYLDALNAEALADDLPAEYDAARLRDRLKDGVRGKYVTRYQQGTNLVKLDPDLVEAFPTEQSVNDALRQLLKSDRLPA